MSEQTCLTPSCLTDRQVKEAVMSTKLTGVLTLSAIAVGLLSYSVFWQAPTIRAEMAKEINRLDTTDREMKSDMERMGLRISALEGK